jgi:phosphate transport system protein
MERQHFVQELDRLKMTILNMAALTRRAVGKAVQAYLTRDEALALEVIEGDQKINGLELEVDRLCLKLLALEQPMAGDLRYIIGSTKISNELERIADQAVNIAERTQFLCQHPPLEPVKGMEQLVAVVEAMLDKAVSSLVNLDPKKAREIRQMDDQADLHTLEVLQTLIDYLVQSTPAAERRLLKTRRSIQMIIISRCLERVADLSTNIGEYVAFIVTGINIKHHKIPPALHP